MHRYYCTAEVRAAEAQLFLATPEGLPMRRAAWGIHLVVARELLSHTGAVSGRSVGLLIGSGDNGGDGLWAGAFLLRRGVAVTAVLLGKGRVHARGLAAFRSAGGRVVQEFPKAVDLVLDGIVGISGKGPLRPEAAELVSRITVPIIAVDVPSGVDADSGVVDGPAVKATLTVACGALKPAHALAPLFCGRIELVDIGLDLPQAGITALESSDVSSLWPTPGPKDNKYSQGVVGIIAGSTQYRGAGLLTVGAAVAATSAMVRYVGDAGAQIVSHYPEVVVADTFEQSGAVQAWVFGPGSGTDKKSEEVLVQILASDLPVLIDADGLSILARRPDLVRARTSPTLLTPHEGEFARLTGKVVPPDRMAAVRDLADKWKLTVLLKGSVTVIADGRGQVRVHKATSHWAATAGAGDVLSGVLGSLLAAGLTPLDAASAGALVHTLAAEQAAKNAPTSASMIVKSISRAISEVREICY
ncbi:MAG: NAD(P)H-hydrate dehydratase [Mycobacteriaceae bacterium]